MKNKLTKISSGFIFAVFTATICAPSAIAAPVTDVATPGSSFVSQAAADQTVKSETSPIKALSAVSGIGFSATIVLNATSGSQVIDAKDSDQKLSDLLQSHGFDSSDFRSADDTAIDENYKLANSENLSLFKSEASGESSVVNLPAPEIRKDSADVYVGEEKVEQEGKAGTALRTVITTKNLAADTAVNASAKKATSENSSEEKLTILTAPEPKIILVGTKERSESNTAVSSPIAATVTAPAAPAGNSATSRNVVSESAAATPSAPAVSNGSVSSSSNNGFVNRAMAQLGKPYVYGAAGANAFDCSGLVQFAFGGNIPRTAYAQGLAGTPVNPANMQPGDLVYTSYHIGIYVGNGKMVHAATPATGVILDDVNLYLAQGYKVSRL